MKLCPQCLIPYDDDQKYCSRCGSSLIEDPDAAPAAPEEPETEPERELPEQPEIAEEAPAAPEIEDFPEAEEEAAPPVQPEPEPKKNPREEKKEERRRQKLEREAARRAPIGAGRRFLAVLLSVLLFVFAFAASLGAELRIATGAEGLKALLGELELGSLRVDPFFDDVDEELSLSGLLSEDLETVGVSLSEKSVTKILRKSTLKDYLAEQLAEVFSDIYSGRSRYEFEVDDLAEELMNSKNQRAFERENLTLDRDSARTIARLIEGYGFGDILSRDEIREEYPSVYNALHFGLSVFTLGGMLALILLLAGLIFKANKGRIGYSLGDIGGVLIAVGAVLGLAGLLAKLLPDLWQSLCFGEELAAQISGAVLISNWRVSLSVFCAGLLLAVLGRLLRGRRKPETAPAQG